MILILFLTGVFGQATTEASPQNFAAQASSQDFATDRILVKFKTGALAASRQTVNARQRGTVVREISRLGIQVVEVPAGTVAQKIRDYKGESSVEFAEPDYVVKAIGVPNDTYYANQWGMTKIQAPQAWDITTGNATVIIAILDTGVDQDHADLAGKIESNKNYTTSNTTDDLYGHGTHVAGIAAAITNNTLGVAGVGYNSRIMNVKVLSDNGSGSTSGVVNGIIWAADNGAKVINLSLGDTNYSQTMQDAIDYAWNRGVVIVAAAGNDGVSTPHYPAYYSNAIAVAATDNVDAKASFSTYGSWVDVAAPGVNIFSTLPNHPNSIGLNYDYLSGTSMAAPYVAGLAGLLWATSYGTSNTNVRNRIESTADNISGTGTNWQFGRINAYNAVRGSLTPLVTTDNATNITTTGARLNGNLSYLGGAASANVSFQWGLSSGNYSANTTAVSANATGAFSANITGLSSDTTYYFRARAVGQDTGYGIEKSFTTFGVLTSDADNITASSARLRGVLVSLGSSASANVSFQWGTGSGNYSANTTAVSVNTTGAFSANITGLSSDTTYYFRARADGGAYGIAYGTEKSFMPLSITTGNADNITTSAARLNGNLTSLGSAASANVSFQWGLSSDNYSANTTAVSVNTTDAFSANITGLSSDTTYYFRAKAVTDNTTYGTEKSFTTLSIIPLVTTDNATNITTTGARLNGNLTYLGGATSANVSFQWGLSSGNYTDNTSAVSVNVIGAFSENITALTPVTTYYFRAKAGTDNTTYGIEKSFITLSIIPLLITDNATNITTTAARLNGNLTYLGGSASANVSFQWGLSSGNYSANTSAVSVNATGVFSENITALTPVTTYYFRAKAVTDNTTYGIEKSFTTLSIAPSVTTDGSSSVTTNSATLSGSLTSMGTATTVNASFEYGTTTAYGSSTTTQAISSPGTFIANITGLVAGTQYHFRTKADGGTSGVSYGIDMTFTTSSAGGGGGGGGGGGSGGGGSSARVDLTDFTSSGVITLNSSGATTTSYIIESADKNCTIQIAGGTKLVDASGIPLTSLTHGIPATVPDAPANVGVLSAQELGPSGARFDPAINLTLTYDQTKLSSGINEETPYIAFWDGTNWTALPTVLDTTLSEATASITHFTIFAVMVPTPVVTLPITPPTPVETLPMIPSAPVVTPPIAPSAPVEIPLITPPTPVAPIPSITPSTQVEPTPPTALTAPTLPTAPAATLTPTLAPIVAAKGGFQWWWGVSGAIGLVIIGIGFVIRRRSRATLSRPGQSLKKQ